MRGSILGKLAGDSVIYGFSTILARVINFLFVPIYTVKLSTGSYGIASEFLAYIAILQVILTLGLETGCFNFANKNREPNVVFSNALITVGTFALLFLVSITLFSSEISHWMGYDGFAHIIVYVGCILAIDSYTAILFARFRFQNRAAKFAMFKSVKILTETALNFILFFGMPLHFRHHPDSILGNFISPTPDFTYIIFAIFVSSVVLLLIFIPEMLKVKLKFHRKTWREMMYYSIPLMIAGLPGILNDTIDRPLFRFLTPPGLEWSSELGIFQAGAKIATIMVLFIQMFRYAAEPFFFSRASGKRSKEEYAMVMEHFTALTMFIFLGITLFIDVIALIIGKDFRAGMDIVPIMLLSYVLLGMNFNISMWYKLSEKTKYAVYITAAGIPATLLINVIFMPIYSYHAAAWGHLISYMVMIVINVTLAKKHYHIPYNWSRISLFIVTGVVLYLVSLLFSNSLFYIKYPVYLAILAIFVALYLRVENINLPKIISQWRSKL